MSVEPAQMASLSFKVEINAPASKVWKTLTADIDQWWPADFYAGGEQGKRNFILERHPGGRMYEQWDDGGVLWGNVVGINPNKQLQILGSVFPSFGGPSQWFGTWDLNETSAGTTELTFSEVSLGRVSDKGTGEKESGWRYLFNCMHAFIDGRKPPEWGQPVDRPLQIPLACTRLNKPDTFFPSEVNLGRISDKGTGEKESGWRYLFNCIHTFIDGREAPEWG